LNNFCPALKRESNLRNLPFPLEVIHTGAQANNMEMFHWHDFMEISYIESGTGLYEIEDKVIPVKAGDVIIINNIEKHKVTFNNDDPLYETVIHFDLEFIREFNLDEFGYIRLFIYNSPAFNNKPEVGERKADLADLIRQITREYAQQEPYYKMMIKSRLLTVITILLRASSFVLETNELQMEKRKNIERIERILTYIDNNFNEEISMENTAQKFFMNTSYFSDYFKKNLGINFSHYLTQKRVKEAIKRMKTGTYNNTEIAFECGFNNITSFYNSFKKITGMTPNDYRKAKIF
jgi:AraC-like DNA-binding protein